MRIGYCPQSLTDLVIGLGQAFELILECPARIALIRYIDMKYHFIEYHQFTEIHFCALEIDYFVLLTPYLPHIVDQIIQSSQSLLGFVQPDYLLGR